MSETSESYILDNFSYKAIKESLEASLKVPDLSKYKEKILDFLKLAEVFKLFI